MTEKLTFRRRNRLTALVLALAFVAGCGDSTGPVPSVGGDWSGSVPRVGGGGNVVFTVALSQAGTLLTGIGHIDQDGGAGSPVTGTITRSGAIAFAYNISTQEDPETFLYFEGQLASAARIEGTLLNWSSAPVAIAFTKQ